jgi:hypothetical protein
MQELSWRHKGVTGAGLLVSLSDRSFFDTFKEAGVLGKHLAQAKQGQLERTGARDRERRGGTGVRTDELSPRLWRRYKRETTPQSKAPDELEAYRQFVVGVAQSRTRLEGAKRLESYAIEKISFSAELARRPCFGSYVEIAVGNVLQVPSRAEAVRVFGRRAGRPARGQPPQVTPSSRLKSGGRFESCPVRSIRLMSN